MLFPDSRILVFSKAPELGKVKTRLADSLNRNELDGDQVAVRIQKELTLHTLTKITENNIAPVQLWCSPDTRHSFFLQCKKMFNVELKEQGDGDLGNRMLLAFKETLSDSKNAILIGNDCPVLTSSVVKRALSAMNEKHNAVIGPAEDGGYVLLGLSKLQTDIFKEVSWGSSKVYEETLQKMQGDILELEKMWDVDRVEDLERLLLEENQLGLTSGFKSYLESLDLINCNA